MATAVSAEMMVAMQEWRLQHPKATLEEIAEVKTLAIGMVRTPVQERGEWVVHTEGLSYFSRLTDLQGP